MYASGIEKHWRVHCRGRPIWARMTTDFHKKCTSNWYEEGRICPLKQLAVPAWGCAQCVWGTWKAKSGGSRGAGLAGRVSFFILSLIHAPVPDGQNCILKAAGGCWLCTAALVRRYRPSAGIAQILFGFSGRPQSSLALRARRWPLQSFHGSVVPGGDERLLPGRAHVLHCVVPSWERSLYSSIVRIPLITVLGAHQKAFSSLLKACLMASWLLLAVPCLLPCSLMVATPPKSQGTWRTSWSRSLTCLWTRCPTCPSTGACPSLSSLLTRWAQRGSSGFSWSCSLNSTSPKLCWRPPMEKRSEHRAGWEEKMGGVSHRFCITFHFKLVAGDA